MAKPKQTEQLSMDLGGPNPFAERLRQGEFSVLVEFNTPLAEQPFESAVTVGRALARQVRDVPLIGGMSVTDRLRAEACHDPVAVAETLGENSGKPVLLHVSGKGSDTGRIKGMLARAGSREIRNILAVTGDRSDRHPPRQPFGRFPRHPVGYHDSVDTIRLARRSEYPFCIGAGINPFKYTPADQYLQYYKLVRKLATGAEFVVTHVGWDMRKLQELQWFLQMRDIGVPAIARVALLSPEQIASIQDGPLPGVPVSRSFAATLQRESDINATQSMAAQLQRIGLQVAGCKLLGYSGVQLVGVDDPKVLDMVLGRVTHVLGQISNYRDWVGAWQDHHMSMDFSPLADAYYVFTNLLSPDQQLYSPDHCPMTARDFPQAVLRDRLRSWALERLLSEHSPGAVRRAVEQLLCRECGNGTGRSRYSLHLCPSACPKGLVYGACGGSAADGTCEFGHARCFHHRVLALAARGHVLDRLEEAISDD